MRSKMSVVPVLHEPSSRNMDLGMRVGITKNMDLGMRVGNKIWTLELYVRIYNKHGVIFLSVSLS